VVKKDAIRYELADLKASMKAIRESGKDIAPETKRTLKVGMNLIAHTARGSMRNRSGGGGYPRAVAGGVKVRTTTLTLDKSGHEAAFGAEFGARRAWIFGRVTTQKSIGFRQFAPFGGSGFSLRGRVAGYHIGPAIKKFEPIITKDLNETVNRMIVSDQRKRGVKSRATGI